MLGDGRNRYQLLAVEDLVEAVVLAAAAPMSRGRRSTSARGEFGTVREDLEALIGHAGSGSRVTPVPGRARRAGAPGARARAALPARRVALQDGAPRLVRRHLEGRAAARLAPALSNAQALIETYDWYLANRGRPSTGPGSRTGWPGTSERSAC